MWYKNKTHLHSKSEIKTSYLDIVIQMDEIIQSTQSAKRR